MRRGGAVKSKDSFLLCNIYYFNRLVKVNQYNITHPP